MEPLSANDPRVVGEFALRARLGSGGMGRVYLGFSPGGRAVAIKVVHPELARDPEFLRRFRQEVASARRSAACTPRRWSARGSTTTRPGWPPPTFPARRWPRW